MTGLPKGWTETTLGEVAKYQNGRAFKPNEWNSNGLPIVRIQNLNDDKATFNFSDKRHERRFSVQRGDLLFAWSASLGAYIWQGGEAWLNQHIFRVDHHREIDRQFLYHILSNVVAELYEKAHGSGMVHVTKKKFEQTQFWLPPFNQQLRIVDKIETLFDEINRGVESLRAAKMGIEQYRQSLLKAAFEGRFTADWRAENPDKLESQNVPLAYSASNSLPWPSVQAQALLKAPLINGKSVKEKEGGFRVLRLTALKNGQIHFHESKEGDWCEDEAAPFLVKEGDVFISRGNGSKKLVGIGGLVPNEPIQVAFPDTMIRVRLNAKVVQPEYFVLVWNSWTVRQQIEQAARTTAGIYKINQTHIRGFILPLPSLSEQSEIVRILDERLNTVGTLGAEIDAHLARADTLRQSILKQAFLGKLVPQDPNDEPAAALLERIRIENASKTRKRANRRIEVAPS